VAFVELLSGYWSYRTDSWCVTFGQVNCSMYYENGRFLVAISPLTTRVM
jgi:hypothetical protein